MSKGGLGKRKGASFERKVCEKLSRWVDPDSTETLYWRSAMSGGRSTVRGKRGVKDSTQAGDITCIDPKGNWLTANFVIECKHYRDLQIKSGLLTGKGKLAKFWKQVRKEAKRHDKHPMLIAKENNTRTLLLMNLEGIQSMATWKPSKEPKLLFSNILKAYFYDFDNVVKP